MWPGQRCSLGYALVELIEVDLGIELTREQADRVVAYYELDPVSGARLVRRAALRRPKGAGKSPEGGYLAYGELVGPVVFDSWEAGQPAGVPHLDPWVQLAAVSEDQTDNVMVWLFDTLAARPDVCAERGVDLGRTRIYLKGRPGRIEPVTASAGSREGQRITFAVLDQTESWFPANGGKRLADTIRRNAAKMGGWTLELQNAPEHGDGSVADETSKAAEKSAAGVLFDTRPAPEVGDLADRPKLIEALKVAYGESAQWVSLERLADEIQDPATDPSDARRYYLNQSAPRSERAFDLVRWEGLLSADPVKPGSLVVLGFDGSRFDDATALVAIDVVSGRSWLAGLWERPADEDDWEVSEAEVSATVAEMFGDFDVWRLYADPAYWSSAIASWSGRWGDERVVEWWTNRPRQIGYACRNLAQSIRAGEIAHNGDSDLARHLRNAVRRPVNSRDEEGRPLWTIRKESPGRKIDAAMALVLAWEARGDAIAAGAKPKRKAKVHSF